jgi:hypothetical protein
MTAVPPDLAYLQWLIDECGYMHPRPLPGDRWAVVWRKAYTHAIIIGRMFDRTGYDHNFCYETYAQAKAALDAWDGIGEPQGWFRDPGTGRRRTRTADEKDGNGTVIGAVGVEYFMS